MSNKKKNNTIMKKEDLAYYFSVITAAADAGMEIDETDELIMIFTEAELYLIDNRPNGVEYIQTDLDTDGKEQSYIFVDECGHETRCSGEIFDFGNRYTKEDKLLFHLEDNADFTPCSWFDIPSQGEEGRNEYVFVFDTVILPNGKVAMLYDHFA